MRREGPGDSALPLGPGVRACRPPRFTCSPAEPARPEFLLGLPHVGIMELSAQLLSCPEVQPLRAPTLRPWDQGLSPVEPSEHACPLWLEGQCVCWSQVLAEPLPRAWPPSRCLSRSPCPESSASAPLLTAL